MNTFLLVVAIAVLAVQLTCATTPPPGETKRDGAGGALAGGVVAASPRIVEGKAEHMPASHGVEDSSPQISRDLLKGAADGAEKKAQ